METREITIRVAPEAARVYELSSAEKRRKLDALLSIWLSEIEQPNCSLEEIMQDASEQAQRKGITPELLQQILDE